MDDIIITGASRGIGRALALELGCRGGRRLLLTARNEDRLKEVAALVRDKGVTVETVAGDLSSVRGAKALGLALADAARPGAMLIHNAGLWPARRALSPDGFEMGFAVNHLGPLTMQESLLGATKLARVMVVSAGLIEKGRFDPVRTPVGDDFSGFRTYCTTKLCFAIAMRDIAAKHPELDVVALHPGVVRTDLGNRGGPLGWLLSLVKRRWEDPRACATRLADLALKPQWSPPGEPRWMFEADEAPWPSVVVDPTVVAAVREATEQAQLASSC